MKYKITKLDGRYSHREHYEYLIEFSKSNQIGTGVLDFDRARRWFNQKFGWSQDVEQQDAMIANQRTHKETYLPDDINFTWAYCAKYNDYRIYVATDKELNWFVLSHPKD